MPLGKCAFNHWIRVAIPALCSISVSVTRMIVTNPWWTKVIIRLPSKLGGLRGTARLSFLLRTLFASAEHRAFRPCTQALHFLPTTGRGSECTAPPQSPELKSQSGYLHDMSNWSLPRTCGAIAISATILRASSLPPGTRFLWRLMRRHIPYKHLSRQTLVWDQGESM